MKVCVGRVSKVSCLLCVWLWSIAACGPETTSSTGEQGGGDSGQQDMRRDQDGNPVGDMTRGEEDLTSGGGEDAGEDVEEMGAMPDGGMGPDLGDARDMGGEERDLSMDMMPPQDLGMDGDMSGDDMQNMPDMPPAAPVYVGNGDVFMPGALAVSRASVTVQPDNTRLALWYPSDAGAYAVIVFQHGFLMDTAYYDSMLTRIASHGFIVAAPQMYAPGDNPVGKPTSGEEAANARVIWQGLDVTLAAALPAGVEARTDRLGVAGHSRGAKVIWNNLIADPSLAMAAVGVDPVDGNGVLGGDPAVLPSGGVNFSMPVLLIGAGLGPVQSGIFGPACAPAQDGYLSFYAASQSPVYELVATEYGHLDMLEDQPAGCGFVCSACEDGSGPRSSMRSATAGWTVALMRSALQGSDNAIGALTSPDLAPVSATARAK